MCAVQNLSTSISAVRLRYLECPGSRAERTDDQYLDFTPTQFLELSLFTTDKGCLAYRT